MELNFNISEDKQTEIQNKINESAIKATFSAIDDYFNSYNSKFKENVKQQLGEQEFGIRMDLPKVIALINQHLSNQISEIANRAVAETFIPLVHRFLTSTEPIVKMSDFLKECIKETSSEYGNFHFECKEHEKHKWLDCSISYDDIELSFTLHKDQEYKGNQFVDTGFYKLLSLPYEKSSGSKQMKLVSTSEGNKKIELYLPFTTSVLENPVISFMSRILLSGSKFELDCDWIDEDWFYEED